MFDPIMKKNCQKYPDKPNQTENFVESRYSVLLGKGYEISLDFDIWNQSNFQTFPRSLICDHLVVTKQNTKSVNVEITYYCVFIMLQVDLKSLPATHT